MNESMEKFVKKPVIIEAFQMTKERLRVCIRYRLVIWGHETYKEFFGKTYTEAASKACEFFEGLK